MGNADAATKKFMGINENAAELINLALFNGERKVRPEDLTDADTSLIFLNEKSDGSNKEKNDFADRTRDIYKKLSVCKTDGKKIYAMIGIENQTNVHYAMPVRCALYDMLSYMKQVERKENGSKKKFGKDDKLIPVITIVVHFNTSKWSGALSLKDMMTEIDSSVEPYVFDYRMNLIDIHELTDEQLTSLETELRPVFEYIKNANDKLKLIEVVNNDEAFKNVSNTAAHVINSCTDSTFKISSEKEGVNMCQALREIREDSIAIGKSEGIAIGKSEGIAIGKSEGIAIGKAKGKAEEKLASIQAALDNDVSLELALKIARITEDEYRSLLDANNLS